jgi:hypothetical protein
MPRKKYAPRVTVAEEHQEKYKEILRETGIKTGSQLLAIFIVKYGDALIERMRG